MMSVICYMNSTLVCLCLSMVAQLGGMLVPSLLHYTISYDIVTYSTKKGMSKTEGYASRNFAIWYVITCTDGNCQFSSYQNLHDTTHDFESYHSFHGYDFSDTDSKYPLTRQVEFQVEATLALVLVVVTVVLVMRHRKRYLKNMLREGQEQSEFYRHAMSILCALISGSLIWIPVCAFIQVNRDVKEMVKEGTINNTGYFPNAVGTPYAVISSGTGGVLAVISCLFIFGAIFRSSKCGKNSNCEDNTFDLNRTRSYVHPSPLLSLRAHRYVTPSGASVGLTEPAEDLSLNQHNTDDETVEEPPPSYEECMRQPQKPPC